MRHCHFFMRAAKNLNPYTSSLTAPTIYSASSSSSRSTIRQEEATNPMIPPIVIVG